MKTTLYRLKKVLKIKTEG